MFGKGKQEEESNPTTSQVAQYKMFTREEVSNRTIRHEFIH
jgi:hypothetical protein